MKLSNLLTKLASFKHTRSALNNSAVLRPKITRFHAKHMMWKILVSFDQVIRGLDAQLGEFDSSIYGELLDPQLDKAEIESKINAMTGSSGLMLFEKQDHGRLLELMGKPAFGIQYVIGNPLIAIKMTSHDIRAGLYAPLRLFVFSQEDQITVIEYDLPSSLFGQFGSSEVKKVALELDEKLVNLIKTISSFKMK
jgi:uncharacterized protein (DUF302 family)